MCPVPENFWQISSSFKVNTFFKRKEKQDFPGSPVVKILHFHWFDPSQKIK